MGPLLPGIALATGLAGPVGVELSEPVSCPVLEAVIADPIARSSDSVVATVQPQPPQGGALAERLEEARSLGLTATEMSALERLLRAPPTMDPRPCGWQPFPVFQARTEISVSDPLFLAPDTAFVDLKVGARDAGAVSVCVVRLSTGRWRPSCRQTVIWAR